MTIGFIGAGHIAGAIISGIIAAGEYTKRDIYIYDTNKEICAAYGNEGFNVAGSDTEIVLSSNIVFLCIRQPDLPGILNEIKSAVTHKNVIVSVIAGVSIGYIKNILGRDCKVIRTMPNMPLQIRRGVTAIAYDMPITYTELNAVKDIFETTGIVEVLPEEQMNEIISVSSSSPAYIYILMRAMIDGAVQQGISKEVAERMVLETVTGSVEYARVSGKSLDDIINGICSPNGTTIKAVDYLEKKGFEQSVKDAMLACTKRAYMLEKEM